MSGKDAEPVPPATLRCGGDWVALDEHQFACLTWMWHAFGHTGTPVARMFSAGGRFDHEAIEDIGGFVADVRGKLGETIEVETGARHAIIRSRDAGAFQLLVELGLPYEKHSARSGKRATYRRGKRVTKKDVMAATLGDVPPLLTLLGALDAFCRRVRENGDPLEVDLRHEYEWI